jgi:two-component system sensor histidine kinase MprB
MSTAGRALTWLGRPSLRRRLALLSALAVVVAIAAASALAYLTMAEALRSQVDRALLTNPLTVGNGTGTSPLGSPTDGRSGRLDPESLCSGTADVAARFQVVIGTVQVVRADGSTCARDPADVVAVTAADVAVANGGAATAPRDDVTDGGTRVRVRTTPLGSGYALLVARDLTDVDATLHRLALVLVVATGAGALLATIVGLLVARTGLRPIDDLTRTAESIAATQDLSTPIPTRGDDEVARLATAFNAMTTALAVARARQQQLVADAGHELRTPLTSLRTNIELLARSEAAGRPLPPEDRSALLESLTAQLAELGDLVSELTALSHDEVARPAEHTRLDEVVRRAVERAARRGDHELLADLEPWELDCDPSAMERAVLNVLDNAVKFSPPRSTVRIRLTGGVLTVHDAGPGIPEADRPRVFDRFWRSEQARGMPGSGLGLAIVADTITRLGGTVTASTADGGGALVTLTLPGQAVIR